MFQQYVSLFTVPIVTAIVMAAFCGLLGPFVLLKRLAFLTDTIAHACIFGIALGFAMRVEPEWTLLPFAGVLGFSLSRLSRRSSEGLSNLTAVAFSLFLGFGSLILSYRGIAGTEMVHVLFGDILWVSSMNLILLCTTLAVAAPFLFLKWKSVTLALMSREIAQMSGIRVDLVNDLFLVLVAIALALCTKIVGVLLVSSLVVLPAFLAGWFASSFRAQLVLSLLIAIGGTMLGVALAFLCNLPVGPSISSVLGMAMLIGISFGSITRTVLRGHWGQR